MGAAGSRALVTDAMGVIGLPPTFFDLEPIIKKIANESGT